MISDKLSSNSIYPVTQIQVGGDYISKFSSQEFSLKYSHASFHLSIIITGGPTDLEYEALKNIEKQ